MKLVTLETEGLTAGYIGRIAVIQDVMLKVYEGSITLLVGPNGSGKSTLLKTLYGYLRPMEGRVRLRGKDITNLKPHERMREGLALVPQLGGFFPDLSVKENLELGAWLFKQDKERVRKAIASAYDRYPFLKEKKDDKARNLSGGQQRMLLIARALMIDPSIVMLDEPTAGLSPLAAEEVYKEVGALKKEGRTLIIVDHNIRRGIELADYVYVMETGRVTSHGPATALRDAMEDLVRGWFGRRLA